MQKKSAIVGNHLFPSASKTIGGGLVLYLFSLNQSKCGCSFWKWFLALVACQFDGLRSQQLSEDTEGFLIM